MKTSILLGATLILLFTACSAQSREFTSSSGQRIIATIQGINGDKVILKRSDGKVFTIPLTRFSAEDQAYIQKWKKDNKGKVPDHLKNKLPRLNMVVTNAARSSKEGDNRSGFVNEKKKKLQLKAVLANEDAVYPIPNAKLAFMVWGKSPESGKNAVVYRQEFKNLELPLNITKTYQTPLLEIWYDDIGAMYGHEYKGYFVLVTDPDDKVLGAKTMPASAMKAVKAINQLRLGDTFDRSYKRTGKDDIGKTVKTVRK